jgi:hypothetical protein
MHSSTSSHEPLEPGEGRVARVEVELRFSGYTLGFHHLHIMLALEIGNNMRCGGVRHMDLLVLNWKDGEEKWVWVRRSFCGRGAWATAWQRPR